VNAGVGAAGAVNSHALAADRLKCAFQFVLDRVAMCLALPTGEGCTVVSNG
jgi:hypothetical protein